MAKPWTIRLYHWWQETLSIHRWVAFVLPMAIFMLITALEPKPDQVVAANEAASGNTTDGSWLGMLGIEYSDYPWIYAVKLIATAIALRLVWPVYRPLIKPIGWKGIAIGIAGGLVWIGLCELEWERRWLAPILESIGLGGLFGSGERSAFNPWEEYPGQPLAVAGYLLVRGLGLIVLVPVMEEYFLRGFLMRFLADDRWWKYPIGKVTWLSAVLGTIIPMLMHPGELLAAAVWFSMITLLMVHTKNLWECIAAHAVTNFILGAYVITYGAWYLV